MSGSLSSSTMSLSISVSAPVTTRFTSLSCSREICRTTRASLSNAWPERDHAHLEDPALHLREVPVEGAVQARELDRASSRASRRRGSAHAVGQARDGGPDRSRARRRLSSGDRACGCRRGPSGSPSASDSSLRPHRGLRSGAPPPERRARRTACASALLRRARRRRGTSSGVARRCERPAPCVGRREGLARRRAAAAACPTSSARRPLLAVRRRVLRRTSSMVTFGPVIGAPQELDRRAARHEDLELDRVDVARRRRSGGT